MPTRRTTKIRSSSEVRQCLLVVTVNRTDASDLAHLFNLLGADLPASCAGNDDAERLAGPPPAVVESSKLAALNEAILRSAGTSLHGAEAVHGEWYESPKFADFKREACELIDAEFKDSSLFVLSDVRVARLVPFWRSVFEECGISIGVVAMFGNSGDPTTMPLTVGAAALEAARSSWLRSVLEGEFHSRDLVRYTISRDVLSRDWEAAIRLIADQLRLRWPAGSRAVRNSIAQLLSPGQRTQAATLASDGSAPDADGWLAEVANIVASWSLQGERPDDYPLLDRVRHEFERAMEVLGQQVDLAQRLASDTAMLVSRSPGAGATDADGAAPAAKMLDSTRDEGELRAAHDRELEKCNARWSEVFQGAQLARDRLSEQNSLFRSTIDRLLAEIDELKQKLELAAVDRSQILTLASLKEVDLIEAKAVSDGDLAAANETITGLRSELEEATSLAVEQGQAINQVRAQAERNAVKAKKSLESKELQIDKLKQLAEDRLNSIAELRANRASKVESLQTRITELEWQLHLAKIEASRTFLSSTTRLFGKAGSLVSHKVLPLVRGLSAGKAGNLQEKKRLVQGTDFFDASWYLAQNADVREAGIEPLDHFIRFGGQEGRAPSPRFDSRWYLNAHKDVSAAGLNPLLHFIEFGQAEGRAHRQLSDSTDRDTKAAGGETKRAADRPKTVALAAAKETVARPLAAPAILEESWQARPLSWSDAGDGGAQPAPRAEAAPKSADNVVMVGGTVIGHRTSGKDKIQASITGRLALFEGLRNGLGHMAQAAPAASPALSVGPDSLGLNFVTDGWFTADFAMRLRLNDVAASDAGPRMARVLQWSLAGTLSTCAEWAINGEGFDVVDVALDNPFAPLLLIVADTAGAIVDIGILPFPSLCRGGAHYGELAVVETAPGSWASLRDYSLALIVEMIGWQDRGALAPISEIQVDLKGATGTEPIFRDHVINALLVRFGIHVRGLNTGSTAASDQLAATLAPSPAFATSSEMADWRRENSGTALVVPPDALPSLAILVARHVAEAGGLSQFCMVDTASGKPAYVVGLPAPSAPLLKLQNALLPAQFPYLVGAKPQRADASKGQYTMPLLAVRFYSSLTWSMDPLMPAAPDEEGQLPTVEAGALLADADGPLLSIIIDIDTNSAGLADLIKGAGQQSIATQCEIILCTGDPNLVISTLDISDTSAKTLRLHCDQSQSPAQRLNNAVDTAKGGFVMILQSHNVLHDPRTAETLVAIASLDGAASASCALVSEDLGGKKPVLSTHLPAYFPSYISFRGEPHVEFAEIDVVAPLPAATFPVVANQLECAVIPTKVWRQLGGLAPAAHPFTLYDLDFGIRAISAGYSNYCTTLVRVGDTSDRSSKDFPDPVSHRHIELDGWCHILANTTVVRELRR